MTTLTDSGQGMDVAIGGLGFKVAISKEQPYERATAQFRKEQFDSTPTVGDQSLTGMWTRGQLSFHKGAGVTYYEVLEGETVLERYDDSNGVDVHTPGVVSLLPSLSDMSLATIDAVPAPLSAGGGIYALTDTGVFYTAGASSTFIDTSDSGVPNDITSSGSKYYVTNGAYIEQQYATPASRTNHLTNPSFEVDTAGWGTGGGGGSNARSSTQAKYGTYSLRANPGAGTARAEATVSGLTVGVIYQISAWVYLNTGPDPTITVALKFDGTTMGTSTLENRWERLSGTFTASATSHTFQVTKTASGDGQPFYLDACMVTESPYEGDYFDGSQPGASWQGVAHASKSDYATPSNNDSTALITLSGGAIWMGVWWAKGRIFAVDSDGYWYALAAATATVTNVDAFWNSGRTGVAWVLTEGTSPIYITDGYDIFTVTVDVDGVVPTLSSPTTAAQMPLGEEISTISYYLGHLIVCTSRGVRVALTQDNDVLLGPLVIEGDFTSANRVGIYDTRAYVVGRPSDRGGDYVLCAIDLGSFVTDLIPAWSPLAVVSSVASTASGAVADATGRVYAWASESLLGSSIDELTSEGYVTTGYHRFGTLEPKFFAKAMVRVGSTGGTVTVYRVDPDGSATSLQVLTESTEVSLGLTATQERIGLKFLLSRDADDPTKGPELLGYQIKALPAPARQRMIRVPLMLMDNERGGNGAPTTGYDGSAWDRLNALETMEASGGVHDWQDFRTGETGTVFIESVEHRGTTSPSSMDDGFGGIVWLTLRKID